MIVYHRTFAAEAILAGGFRDGEGRYLTAQLHRGVWVSDEPLDENEGACGNTYLVLDVPAEVLLEWEWLQDLNAFREFLVPAEVLNRYGPPRLFELPEYPMCAARLPDGSLCGAETYFCDRRRLRDLCDTHRRRGRLRKDPERRIWLEVPP